jgi:hypothetical protein
MRRSHTIAARSHWPSTSLHRVNTLFRKPVEQQMPQLQQDCWNVGQTRFGIGLPAALDGPLFVELAAGGQSCNTPIWILFLV